MIFPSSLTATLVGPLSSTSAKSSLGNQSAGKSLTQASMDELPSARLRPVSFLSISWLRTWARTVTQSQSCFPVQSSASVAGLLRGNRPCRAQ